MFEKLISELKNIVCKLEDEILSSNLPKLDKLKFLKEYCGYGENDGTGLDVFEIHYRKELISELPHNEYSNYSIDTFTDFQYSDYDHVYIDLLNDAEKLLNDPEKDIVVAKDRTSGKTLHTTQGVLAYEILDCCLKAKSTGYLFNC